VVERYATVNRLPVRMVTAILGLLCIGATAADPFSGLVIFSNDVPRFHSTDSSRKGPTGSPQAGVALALFQEMPWMRLSSPLWVNLEIRNVSDDEAGLGGLFPGGL
jgi:hypothetical protein